MQKSDCYIFAKMLYYYKQRKSTKIFLTIKAAALKINSEPQLKTISNPINTYKNNLIGGIYGKHIF